LVSRGRNVFPADSADGRRNITDVHQSSAQISEISGRQELFCANRRNQRTVGMNFPRIAQMVAEITRMTMKALRKSARSAGEKPMFKNVIKRILDIILTLIALIILSPVLLILAILIRLKLGSPVIFTQKRAGKEGKPFTIYKFRTMTNARDAKGKLLPNAQRKTKFGNILRSTSLDELPELWNVLRGNMSLVGPRPLLLEYLPYYNPEQNKRHDVLPGITGWAQINGRNALNWEEKFALDVWYVKHQSLLLDIKILFKTVVKVFQQKNINHGKGQFMPRFDDYKKSRE